MAAAFELPAHVPPERVFDFDIYADPRIGDEVQASYAAAFKDAPDIFYTPRNGGHWMVRRMEAISAIVQDPEHFSAREMQIPRVPDPPYMIPLNVDPPTNLPYRQALMPMLAPRAIRDMEPKIRAWAIRIIEDVAGRGECDFIRDVSSVFPVSIFMELMGMPLERLREFRHLADSFFNAHDPDGVSTMSAQILAVLGEHIEYCRANPANNLVSHLITTNVDGRKLTTDEILAMCFVLFLGGMDTVTNVSGFSYRHLAQDPVLQQRLKSDPSLIPKFVEEGLRCFSVINTPRLVAKDCERLGVRFKAGEMVLCMLTVAGLDDQANSDPVRFDIDREQGKHLTFSRGPHLCVGNILARAEIRILTEEWCQRIGEFSLRPGSRHGFRIGTVTAIESLPLQWHTSRA
ncbi:MAG: cytochrome P450 [Steroidobacteraceae bacterium]